MSTSAPRAIPEISRLQSLRESPAMMQNPIGVFSRYTASLGDTFVFYFGGVRRTVVTSNPDVIRHVLKTNHDNYQKSDIQMNRMREFLGKGLLTTHGEAWRTQRRLIQRGFHRDQIAVLASVMHEWLAEWLAKFDSEVDGSALDMYPRLMQATFQMVARSLFSADFKNEDAALISQTIGTVQEFMVRQIVQPYLDPWFWVSGELSRHQRLRQRGDGILRDYIRQRRSAGVQHSDMLQILMDARYADTGEGMSDELILSESMQLLVAGHETSSNALCWTLSLLSHHPAYKERMRLEFRATLGGRRLQFSDLPRLQFATQVLDEALRLYPPFWMVDRVAVEDDCVGGVPLAKGTRVIVFIYGVHRSAAHWPDPERFLPERFSPESVDQYGFTHLPFGAGPRGCIGVNYAMLQMLMILSELFRKYDFLPDEAHAVEKRPMIILRPKDGVHLRVTRQASTRSIL
jgi:cytochrome P450